MQHQRNWLALATTYLRTAAVKPLIDQLWSTADEGLLHNLLQCLYTMAMCEENKTLIRESGGLEPITGAAPCCLVCFTGIQFSTGHNHIVSHDFVLPGFLYHDSAQIVEDATITLGYLTRDPTNKVTLRPFCMLACVNP